MFPTFFSAAPVIQTVDPLADFLGAAANGLLEYRYEDAVRLAGHSCPTVAGAFLLTATALKELYGADLPVRGEIVVEFADSADSGVTGVIASITTLITGATANTGFRGIAGQFNRRNKLAFNVPLRHGMVRFGRVDSGASVEALLDLSKVPSDPSVSALMPKCLQGLATPDEKRSFSEGWQHRVKLLLTEFANDPEVFVTFPERTSHE